MAPLLPVLLLVVAVAVSPSRAQARAFPLVLSNSVEAILSRPANSSRIFYGVMFDAGSTGTRIHVYTFIQGDAVALPLLDNEMFHSVKPGLSAYADSPEMAGQVVRTLLKVAKRTVPRREWKRTPLVLKATAGLRLLTPGKARALLDQVQEVFDESPFLVSDSSVSIMNGTYEGVLAWVTVNYLSGHLHTHTTHGSTVGILDLGGGSTQITFLPKSRKTTESVPSVDYVARFDMFNSTYELYTHSYLGHGLMAGRLATLGALGAEGPVAGLEWRVFKSACLPKKFRGEWSFGGLAYQISGIPEGNAGYKPCYQQVLRVVKGVSHQPHQLRESGAFYAFSYYYDRAVDAGLIADGSGGGRLEVGDFKKSAREVCNKMTKQHPVHPFLCLDMTYITCLLRDGFGFKDTSVLQLTSKVNYVEASWALGATLHHLHHLKIH